MLTPREQQLCSCQLIKNYQVSMSVAHKDCSKIKRKTSFFSLGMQKDDQNLENTVLVCASLKKAIKKMKKAISAGPMDHIQQFSLKLAQVFEEIDEGLHFLDMFDSITFQNCASHLIAHVIEFSIKTSKQITNLSFLACQELGYNIVTSLSTMDNFGSLKRLSFSKCKQFNSRALRYLLHSPCSSLTQLDISYSSVTEQGGAQILVELGLSDLYKHLEMLNILGLTKDMDNFDLFINIESNLKEFLFCNSGLGRQLASFNQLKMKRTFRRLQVLYFEASEKFQRELLSNDQYVSGMVSEMSSPRQKMSMISSSPKLPMDSPKLQMGSQLPPINQLKLSMSSSQQPPTKKQFLNFEVDDNDNDNNSNNGEGEQQQQQHQQQLQQQLQQSGNLFEKRPSASTTLIFPDTRQNNSPKLQQAPPTQVRVSLNSLSNLDFEQLKHLNLINVLLEEKLFVIMENLSFITRLSKLNFSYSTFEDLESFNHFLISPRLESLEELNLSYTPITDQTLTTFSLTQYLNKLQTLHLTGCRNITSTGLKRLLYTKKQMFSVLLLHDNPIIQDHLLNSLGARLSDQRIQRIATVNFASCSNISTLALQQLFESTQQHLLSLEYLILKETRITNHCLKLIADSPTLQSSLKKLNIDCCNLLTTKGLSQFFQSFQFRSLQHLSMDATLLDDSGLIALASQKPEFTSSLQKLKLKNCSKIGPPGFIALFQSHGFPSLVNIDLDRTCFNDQALHSLSAQPHFLKNLVLLSLRNCLQITQSGLTQFLSAFRDPHPNFDFTLFISSFRCLIDDNVLLTLANNRSLLHTARMLDFNDMSFITTAGLLTFLEKIPTLKRIELLNFNQTKIDDAVLVAVLTSQKFPGLITIQCKDAHFLTPRLMQKIVDKTQALNSGFTRIKLPVNFAIDNFFFQQNVGRINEDSIQGLIQSDKFFSIQKKQQFNSVDLQGYTHMIDSQIIKLFETANLLHNVTLLDFRNSNINNHILQELTVLPHLSNVRTIFLDNCPHVDSTGINIILESSNFSAQFDINPLLQLRHLISDDTFKYIAKSVYISSLRNLNLRNNKRVKNAICNLLYNYKEQKPLNIQVIDLRNTLIQDVTLSCIADSKGRLDNLQLLMITGCPLISEDGLTDLSKSEQMPETFSISHVFRQAKHLLTNNVVKALMKNSKMLKQVRELYLKGAAELESRVFQQLIMSPHLINVQCINLKKTVKIGESAFNELFGSCCSFKTSLRMLLLDEKRDERIQNGIELLFKNFRSFPQFDYQFFIFKNSTCINESIIATFAKQLDHNFTTKSAEVTQPFTHFNLVGNLSVDTDSVSALLQSPFASNLRVINISKTQLRTAVVKAIAQSPYLTQLKTLIIHSCKYITIDFIKFLLNSTTLSAEFDINVLMHLNSYRVDDEVATTLMTCKRPFVQNMHVLNFENSKRVHSPLSTMIKIIQDQIIKSSNEISYSTRLHSLQVLNLNRTLLNNDELKAIVNCPYLKNLREILIQDTPLITTKGLIQVIRHNQLPASFHLWKMISTKKSLLDDEIVNELSKHYIDVARNTEIATIQAPSQTTPSRSNNSNGNSSGNSNSKQLLPSLQSPTLANNNAVAFAFTSATNSFAGQHIFQAVRKLDLGKCHLLTNLGLSTLLSLPDLCLYSLDLEDTFIDDEFAAKLESFASLSRLMHLNVQKCRYLTFDGLAHLMSMHSSSVHLDYDPELVSSLHLPQFVSSPYFQTLNRLSLAGSSVTSRDVETKLCSAPQMENIVRLTLSDTKVNDYGITAISYCPYFCNLRLLDINGLHRLTGASLQALLSSKYLHPNFDLERVLEVYHNNRQIQDPELIELAQSRFLRNITKLDLSQQNVTSLGILKLFDSSNCYNIQQVDLSYTQINDAAVLAIANSGRLRSLKTLRLAHCKVSPLALNYLCSAQARLPLTFELLDCLSKSGLLDSDLLISMVRSVYLSQIDRFDFVDAQSFSSQSLSIFFLNAHFARNIQVLQINSNPRLTDNHIKEIICKGQFPGLRQLLIYQCPEITSQACTYLIQPQYSQHLPFLDINSFLMSASEQILPNLDDSFMEQLQNCLQVANSTVLTLSGARRITSKGWNALWSCKYAINITQLYLDGTTITDNDIQQLCSSQNFPLLYYINLKKNLLGITSQGIKHIFTSCQRFSANFSIQRILQEFQSEREGLPQRGQGINDRLVTEYVNSQSLRNTKVLSFNFAGYAVSESILASVLDNSSIINVEEINFQNSLISDHNLQQISLCRLLRSLRVLQINNCKHVTAAGLVHILGNRNIPNNFNTEQMISAIMNWSDSLLNALAKSEHLCQVQKINFSADKCSSEALQAFFQSEYALHINSITIDKTYCNNPSNILNALSHSKSIQFLQSLEVPHNLADLKPLQALILADQATTTSGIFHPSYNPEQIISSLENLDNATLEVMSKWDRLLNMEKLSFSPKLFKNTGSSNNNKKPVLDISILFQQRWVNRISEIDFTNVQLHDQDFIKMLACTNLTSLVKIEFGSANVQSLGEPALIELVKCRNLNSRFNFQHYFNTFHARITDSVLVHFSQREDKNYLNHFNITDNKNITQKGIQAFFTSDLCSKLSKIDLIQAALIDDDAFAEVADSPHLKYIVELGFTYDERCIINPPQPAQQQKQHGITINGVKHMLNSRLFQTMPTQLNFDYFLQNLQGKINNEILNAIGGCTLLLNVTQLHLDGCMQIDFSNLEDFYNSLFLRNLTLLSVRHTNFSDVNLEQISLFPFFENIELFLIQGCRNVKDCEKVIEFINQGYFNTEKFNFQEFFNDLILAGGVSVGVGSANGTSTGNGSGGGAGAPGAGGGTSSTGAGLKLLDPKFFRKFVQLEYFKFSLFDLDLSGYFSLLQAEDPVNYVQTTQEICNIFFQAQSKTFIITNFLSGIPQDLRHFVTNDTVKQIADNYESIHYLNPHEFPHITFGFNYLLQKQDYPVAFKISYIMNPRIQEYISADSLKQIAIDSKREPTLFSTLQELDLSQNKYLTTYGLTRYIKEQIRPWIQVNQRWQDFNQKKQGTIINPDHNLDDFYQNELYSFISNSSGLKKIILQNQNLSDKFAQKLSLIVSKKCSRLPNLSQLDLSSNERITAFGLKYLYSNILDRFDNNLTFKIYLNASINKQNGGRGEGEPLLQGQSNHNNTGRLKIRKAQINGGGVGGIRQSNCMVNQQTLFQKDNRQFSLYTGITIKQQQTNAFPLGSSKVSQASTTDSPTTKIFPRSGIKRQSQVTNRDLSFLKMKEENELERQIQSTDFKLVFLNLVNNGLYKALNDIFLNQENWYFHWKWFLFMMIILFPFTIFHIYKIFKYWLNKHLTKVLQRRVIMNTITFFKRIILQTAKSFKLLISATKLSKTPSLTTTLELWKRIPEGISDEDFYFDEDVCQLNIVLSSNKSYSNNNNQLSSGQPLSDEVINELLECQSKMEQHAASLQEQSSKVSQQKTKKQIDEIKYDIQMKNRKTIIKSLEYFSHDKPQNYPFLNNFELIYILHFVVYYLFCIIYPFVYIQDCGQSDITYDIPYFFLGFCSLLLEILMINDLCNIINKKICENDEQVDRPSNNQIIYLWSLKNIFMIYASQMSKYDFYTDINFISNTWNCPALNSTDLAQASLSIIIVNLLFNIWHFYTSFIAYRTIRRSSTDRHNTDCINEATKMSYIIDMHAFGHILDRFSTSSAIALDYKWLPKIIRGVYIPQVLLTTFQRVFFEDLPQLGIQIIYNFNRAPLNRSDWGSIKVALSTVLSLLNTLEQAWEAKPSKFNEEIFTKYIHFIQNTKKRRFIAFIKEDDSSQQIYDINNINIFESSQKLVAGQQQITSPSGLQITQNIQEVKQKIQLSQFNDQRKRSLGLLSQNYDENQNLGSQQQQQQQQTLQLENNLPTNDNLLTNCEEREIESNLIPINSAKAHQQSEQMSYRPITEDTALKIQIKK